GGPSQKQKQHKVNLVNIKVYI
nr:RecName: Full=Hemocyanin subunit 6 [Maja squinado]